MNERIKELAEQAGFPRGHRCPMTGINDCDPELERLAQLVAQRCAGIYEAIDNGNAVHGTKNYVQALRREFEVK